MSGPNIYQVASEVDQLLDLMKPFTPRRILEIGLAQGGSMREWCKVAADDALIIGIDLAGNGEHTCGERNQKVHLLEGDSHSPDMCRKVKDLLRGELLDFIFIDGDHSYEGVKADFDMYAGPLVKGIIAFHDIVPGPKDNVGGVPEYWQELKQQYWNMTQREFVRDWNQGGYGIGVMF